MTSLYVGPSQEAVPSRGCMICAHTIHTPSPIKSRFSHPEAAHILDGAAGGLHLTNLPCGVNSDPHILAPNCQHMPQTLTLPTFSSERHSRRPVPA